MRIGLVKEEFGHNEDVLGEGVVVVEMERIGEGEVEDHNDQLPTSHEEVVVPAVVVTRLKAHQRAVLQLLLGRVLPTAFLLPMRMALLI